jgi:hypothetical protein
MRLQLFRWPAPRERGGQDAFSTLAPISDSPAASSASARLLWAMAQVPGTGFVVRLAAAAPGSLPTAHPTRYPRRHGQTTRSAPGQPMTLGNMRANQRRAGWGGSGLGLLVGHLAPGQDAHGADQDDDWAGPSCDGSPGPSDTRGHDYPVHGAGGQARAGLGELLARALDAFEARN